MSVRTAALPPLLSGISAPGGHAPTYSDAGTKAIPASVAYADAAAHARRMQRRTIRVTALVIACVLLGLGDLDMTLAFATSVGLSEANPIARAFMSLGSAWPVIIFKLATMGVGLGMIFRLRRHKAAEAAAWIILALMVALTIRWMIYSKAMSESTEVFSQMTQAEDSRWVVITPD